MNIQECISPYYCCRIDISSRNEMKPKITTKPQNQWVFASRTSGKLVRKKHFEIFWNRSRHKLSKLHRKCWPPPPSGTWCKHPLILRFSGDFWFHFISTWYVNAATTLRSKGLHLRTYAFLNIHVVEPCILEKLLRDVKNFDFVCTSKHNFC